MKKLILLLVLSVCVNVSAKKPSFIHNGQILDSVHTNYIGVCTEVDWDGNTKTIKDITKRDIRTTSIMVGFGGNDGGTYIKAGMSNMNSVNKSGVLSVGWTYCPVENRVLGYYFEVGGIAESKSSLDNMKMVLGAGIMINMFYQHITLGVTLYELKQTKVSVGILL